MSKIGGNVPKLVDKHKKIKKYKIEFRNNNERSRRQQHKIEFRNKDMDFQRSMFYDLLSHMINIRCILQ